MYCDFQLAAFMLCLVDSGQSALQSPGLGEGLEAPVESFFDIIRETAAGQLLDRQMIAYTLTAHSLFVTGICAVTILQVLLFFTFHNIAATFFKSTKLHLIRVRKSNCTFLRSLLDNSCIIKYRVAAFRRGGP